MKSKLYLLVTSERPDPYLNSIMHCLLVEGVRSLEFIYIKGWGEARPDDQSRSESKALTVSHRVRALFEDLASGEYSEFGSNKINRVYLEEVYSSIDVEHISKLYREARDLGVSWSQKDIPYAELRRELRRIARENRDNIIDVSSINKVFFGDLIAVSTIEGLEYLCTFELIEPPDHHRPWSMLFHELRGVGSSQHKYRYTNIISTPIFKECSRSLLVRRPSQKVSAIVGILLLIVTFVLHFVEGPSNWLLQGMLLFASVASIVSLIPLFVPVRE